MIQCRRATKCARVQFTAGNNRTQRHEESQGKRQQKVAINNKPGWNLQVKCNHNRCTAAKDEIVYDKAQVHEVRQKYWLSVIWMGPEWKLFMNLFISTFDAEQTF